MIKRHNTQPCWRTRCSAQPTNQTVSSIYGYQKIRIAADQQLGAHPRQSPCSGWRPRPYNIAVNRPSWYLRYHLTSALIFSRSTFWQLSKLFNDKELKQEKEYHRIFKPTEEAGP
ncbi:hypothetical protein JOM56_014801 [Amanita muscaria]